MGLPILLPLLFHTTPRLCATPPISAVSALSDKCDFFKSLVVGLPYRSIFWWFGYYLFWGLVVILSVVIVGGNACLPMPPSWSEVSRLHFLTKSHGLHWWGLQLKTDVLRSQLSYLFPRNHSKRSWLHSAGYPNLCTRLVLPKSCTYCFDFYLFLFPLTLLLLKYKATMKT